MKINFKYAPSDVMYDEFPIYMCDKWRYRLFNVDLDLSQWKSWLNGEIDIKESYTYCEGKEVSRRDVGDDLYHVGLNGNGRRITRGWLTKLAEKTKYKGRKKFNVGKINGAKFSYDVRWARRVLKHAEILNE